MRKKKKGIKPQQYDVFEKRLTIKSSLLISILYIKSTLLFSKEDYYLCFSQSWFIMQKSKVNRNLGFKIN